MASLHIIQPLLHTRSRPTDRESITLTLQELRRRLDKADQRQREEARERDHTEAGLAMVRSGEGKGARERDRNK